jgi:hypothetical protein
MQLAWLHMECGAYESALDLCRRAMELSAHPARGVGVVMCHVARATASVGLGDAEGALNCAQQALAANTPGETFWRAVAMNSCVHAHLLKGDDCEVQNSARQLLRLSAKMREQTWRAIAVGTCAKAFATTGQKRLAGQCSKSALQIVETEDLPLAKWRVEAMAAETYESFDFRGKEDTEQLRARSRQSREQLFTSLAIHDPLRKYASLGVADHEKT